MLTLAPADGMKQKWEAWATPWNSWKVFGIADINTHLLVGLKNFRYSVRRATLREAILFEEQHSRPLNKNRKSYRHVCAFLLNINNILVGKEKYEIEFVINDWSRSSVLCHELSSHDQWAALKK